MAQTGHLKWIPNPGPQTDAYFSEADELFYGGAAGGGKTDLFCGLALNTHTRSLVLRREGTDLRGIEQRMTEVMGGTDGYNAQLKRWNLGPEQVLELGSCQHEKDKFGYQGRPHDLKAFDEITQFSKSQYQYIIGWNRTTKPGQRCRVVCAGNPPATPEGMWVKELWAPWLDRNFANPARPGELRWFTTEKGETVWVDENWRGVSDDGEVLAPKSRTFIPALLSDNPFLGADYRAKVAAMPEPLRTQLLYGDFNVAEQDQVNQVIPTAWVRAAQTRWKPDGDLQPMVSMGADVAQGGADKFALAPRHLGDHIARIHTLPGVAVEDGPKAAAWVLERQRNGAQINVDMGGGYGSDLRSHLKHANMKVWEYNGANRATRDTKSNLKLKNMRAQIHWNMREILDPAGDRRVALPPDEEMVADLCAATWSLTPQGIQIEAKDHIRERIGRSPDKGEAVMMAFADPKDDIDYQHRTRRGPFAQHVAETRDPLWG